MARLKPTERAGLPDRAFAYVDSKGRRRLPIHDAAHVRNALARFGQVGFESDAARERARKRLLQAAKRFRIVPIGFITSELQSAGSGDRRTRLLPSGFVTMLMTDIEGSTGLVRRLGEGYRELLDNVCVVLRQAIEDAGGHEIEARARRVSPSSPRRGRRSTRRSPARWRCVIADQADGVGGAGAHRDPQRIPDIDRRQLHRP